MNTDIKEGQIWKHYKGELYQIVKIAKNADNGSLIICYQNVNGDDIYWHFWDEFFKKVEDGRNRFEGVKLFQLAHFCNSVSYTVYRNDEKIGILEASGGELFHFVEDESIYKSVVGDILIDNTSKAKYKIGQDGEMERMDKENIVKLRMETGDRI